MKSANIKTYADSSKATRVFYFFLFFSICHKLIYKTDSSLEAEINARMDKPSKTAAKQNDTKLRKLFRDVPFKKAIE